MARRNNNCVQIISELDFFPKIANMTFFIFCDVNLNFQPVRLTWIPIQPWKNLCLDIDP
jgi:hypothetical protein